MYYFDSICLGQLNQRLLYKQYSYKQFYTLTLLLTLNKLQNIKNFLNLEKIIISERLSHKFDQANIKARH